MNLQAIELVVLGAGSYSVVKECVHIDTGRYYVAKVEHMVRNEIAVLKRVSMGHQNILTLLVDRICRKGSYYESDAAELIRSTLSTVTYLHDHGTVHRDMKPDNLLFRTPEDNADLQIADFGLSRIMDGGAWKTSRCVGHRCHRLFPSLQFDRDTNLEEMQANLAADYKFEPADYWHDISDDARNFIRKCLTVDPTKRLTAHQVLQHPFLSQHKEETQADLFNARSVAPETQKDTPAPQHETNTGLWGKPTGGLMKQ
ncbi:kinase-like protein [Terfezia boudieri ATCC MYA-4762]|uniref:Kinase-like protein n=1 Tax=Terfezia boudieri ATCC MYA-4762 TaxID=1051890 RepID=A0A3N4LRV7_9PEZI|nr:kinase-like protein [Terfezia boudieri ATCC MYA-4762]